MNHHHIDRRVARSAECRSVSETATSAQEIERLVRRARAAGVVVFLKAEIERMPWQVQAIIEGEARRLCEETGNG